MNTFPDIPALIHRIPVLSACEEDITAACRLMVHTFQEGGTLLICGNGGSAADAEHMVGELMKGFMKRRPLNKKTADAMIRRFPEEGAYMAERLHQALPAISLSAHTSLCTAVANDISPDLVFAQQVLGYGRSGDMLLAISTSGNSHNVVKAAMAAESLGLHTVGLTGRNGGRLAEICKVTIQVPANSTPEIQELHLPVYHALCVAVESAFFPE